MRANLLKKRPESAGKKKQIRSGMTGLVRMIAVLMCLAAAVFAFACEDTEKSVAESEPVRLNDYIKAEKPVGFDGYGTVNAVIDREKLTADLAAKMRTAEDEDPLAAASKVVETVSGQFYLSNMQNLKNGDLVEIIWKNWDAEAKVLEQKYGIRLIYENTSFSVEGLTGTEEIDPFAHVEIVFRGFNEYGTVSAEASGDYGFSYVFSKTDHLSNGDAITAQALLAVDESADAYTGRTGICVTRTTAEYTVEGLVPLTEADPFDYVTAEYSGMAPDGAAVFAYDPPKSGFPELFLEKDRFSGLSNGDSITLTFSASQPAETYEQVFGIRLTGLTKTYTVGGLSGYVTSLKDIPKETMDRIDAEFGRWAELNDFTELGNNAELQKIEPAGHFLLISGNGSMDNYFGVVHKAIVTDGKNTFVCYPFTFVIGLNLNGDGSFSADSEMMRARFTVTEKARKGKITMYGAESLDSVRKEFLEEAEQKFFVRMETDF